jgi:hypothetical protein
MTLTFHPKISDPIWGCDYQEVSDSSGLVNVKLCYMEVTSLRDFAEQITHLVLDKSWMTNLDSVIKKAYDRTVTQTANKLVQIFNATSATGTLGADFGELMVSIGSAHALERIFTHVKLPIAELWKPQLSQNEGFDFHTTCPSKIINFGEAKYSSSTNPYTLAMTQAESFIDDEKHFRDAVHLKHLVDADCLANLDNNQFGIVAAFSLRSGSPEKIFVNAVKAVAPLAAKNKIENIYLVGVK